ncbi:MAG: GNAT family N-acetyltransferase [Myxococcales bacterium]|nr:GNAT family N-acetyltransferase [Myxococcales bacterium]
MLPLAPRSELRARPLGSQRLLLHPLDVSDAHDLWVVVDASRAWLQPWLPWVPYQQSAETAVRFAEASALDWDQGRAARFTIRERGSGRMLGIVGLESIVELHRACEIGYWLRRDAAGRGYMTEAARACVDFAFHRLRAHRMRVAASTQNHPSLAVIARLGFHFEGIARHAEWCDGRWLDHAVFALLEHEWPGG